MNRVFVAVALVFAMYLPASSADRYTSVVIPAGTQVKMFIVGDVNAQGTRAGDTFQAEAASDVVLDGAVVIQKGAKGEGTVGDAKHPGRSATNPLTLTFDWVYAADGTKVRLSQNDGRDAAAGKQVASSTAGPPPPPGLSAFGMSGLFGFVSAYTKESVSIKAPEAAAQ